MKLKTTPGIPLDVIKSASRQLESRVVTPTTGPPNIYPLPPTHLAVDREKLVSGISLLAIKSGVEFHFSSEPRVEFGLAGQPHALRCFKTGKTWRADVLVGADGAGSATRLQLLCNEPDLSFNIACDSHSYKSARVTPRSGCWLDPSCIHTFPRGHTLLHAMPGISDTNDRKPQHPYFNATLVLPQSSLPSLTTLGKARIFLSSLFPHLLDVDPTLPEQFTRHSPGKIASGSLSRFHGRNTCVVLLGDAAHPVVPYIGQGLVSAVEDCHLFDSIVGESLEQQHISLVGQANWHHIIRTFTQRRKDDIDAMQTLAKEQFDFLFRTSATRMQRARQSYQATMHRLFPSRYPHSLYALLNDPTLSYSQVLIKKRKQNTWYKLGRLN